MNIDNAIEAEEFQIINPDILELVEAYKKKEIEELS